MAKSTDWIKPGEQLTGSSPSASHAIFGADAGSYTATDAVPFPLSAYAENPSSDYFGFAYQNSITKPFIIYTGFDAAGAIPDNSNITGIEVRLLTSADKSLPYYLGPEDAAYVTVSVSLNENNGADIQANMNPWTGDTGSDYLVTRGNLGAYRNKGNINMIDEYPYNIALGGDGWGSYNQQNVFGGEIRVKGSQYHPWYADHYHLGACYNTDTLGQHVGGLDGGLIHSISDAPDLAGSLEYHALYSNWDAEGVINRGWCEAQGATYLRRMWDGHRAQTEEWFNEQAVIHGSDVGGERAPSMLYTNKDKAESSESYYPLYFGGPSESWGFSLPTKTSTSTSEDFLYGVRNTLAIKIALQEWSTSKDFRDLRIHEVAVRFHYVESNYEVVTEQFNLDEIDNGIKVQAVSLIKYFGGPESSFMGVSPTHSNPADIHDIHADGFHFTRGTNNNLPNLHSGFPKVRAQMAHEQELGDLHMRLGSASYIGLTGLRQDENPTETHYETYHGHHGVGKAPSADGQLWNSPVEESYSRRGQLQVELDLKHALSDFAPNTCIGTFTDIGVYNAIQCCEAGGGQYNVNTNFCSGNNPDIAEWYEDDGSEIISIKFNLKAQIGRPSPTKLTHRDKLGAYIVNQGTWNLEDVDEVYHLHSGDNAYDPAATALNSQLWENGNMTGQIMTNHYQNAGNLFDMGWTNYNSEGEYTEDFVNPGFEDRTFVGGVSQHYFSSFNGPYSYYGLQSQFDQIPHGCPAMNDVCINLTPIQVAGEGEAALAVFSLDASIDSGVDIESIIISTPYTSVNPVIGPFINEAGSYSTVLSGGLFQKLGYHTRMNHSNVPNNGNANDPSGCYLLAKKEQGSLPFPDGFRGSLMTIAMLDHTAYGELFYSENEEALSGPNGIIDFDNTKAYDSSGNELSVGFSAGRSTSPTTGWFADSIPYMNHLRMFSTNPVIDIPIDINGGLLDRFRGLAASSPNGRIKLVIDELVNELRINPSVALYDPKLEGHHYCSMDGGAHPLYRPDYISTRTGEGEPLNSLLDSSELTYDEKIGLKLKQGHEVDETKLMQRCEYFGGEWKAWDSTGWAPQADNPDFVYPDDTPLKSWEGTYVNLSQSTVTISYKKRERSRQTQKIMGFFDRQDSNYDGSAPVFGQVVDLDHDQMQVMDHRTHGVQVQEVEDFVFFGKRFSYPSGNTYDGFNGVCSNPALLDATSCMQADESWTPDDFYGGAVSFENAYRVPFYDGAGADFAENSFWGGAYSKYLTETPSNPALTPGGSFWPIAATARSTAQANANSPFLQGMYMFIGWAQAGGGGWGHSLYGLKYPDALGRMTDPFDIWSNWSHLNFGGAGFWSSGTGSGLLWERENNPYGWNRPGFPVGITSFQYNKESESRPCLAWQNYKTINWVPSRNATTGMTALGISNILQPIDQGYCNNGKCVGGRRNKEVCNDDNDYECPGYSGYRMPAGWNLQGTYSLTTGGNQGTDAGTFMMPGECKDSSNIPVPDFHDKWMECMCGDGGRLQFQQMGSNSGPGMLDQETGIEGPDFNNGLPRLPFERYSQRPYRCSSGSPTGYGYHIGHWYDDSQLENYLEPNNKSLITSDTAGTGPYWASESDYLAPPSGTTSIYAHGEGKGDAFDITSNPTNSFAAFTCSFQGQYPWCGDIMPDRVNMFVDLTHSHGGDGRWRILQTPNISMIGAEPETAFLEFWIHMFSDAEEQMGRFFVDVTRMNPETSTPGMDNGTMKIQEVGGDGSSVDWGWAPAELHLYWNETAFGGDGGPTHCGKANPDDPTYFEGDCSETYLVSDSDTGYSLGLETISVFDYPYVNPTAQGDPNGKWWLHPEDNSNELTEARTGRIQTHCDSKDDSRCQWAKVRVPLASFLNTNISDEDNIIRIQFRYVTRNKTLPKIRMYNDPFTVDGLQGGNHVDNICPQCVPAGVQGLGADSDKSDVHIDAVRVVADKQNIFETTFGNDVFDNDLTEAGNFGDGLNGTIGGIGENFGTHPATQDTENGEIDVSVNVNVNLGYARLDNLIPNQEYQVAYTIRNYESGGIRPLIGFYEGIYDSGATDNIAWTGSIESDNGTFVDSFIYRPLPGYTNDQSKWLWFQTQQGFTVLSLTNIMVRPLFDLPLINPDRTPFPEGRETPYSEHIIPRDDVIDAVTAAKEGKDKLNILETVAQETGKDLNDLLDELKQSEDGMVMGFGRCNSCGFPSRVGVCGPLSGGCWGYDNKKKQITWDKRL